MVLVSCAVSSTDPFPVSSLTIDDVKVSVWVADDPIERHQGLRDVDQLPDGIDGMVFMYEAPAAASYVMEDTLIPLDIWWFNEDGVLVGTDEMAPCTIEACPDYHSPGPVLTVLETPIGEYEFTIGSVISTVASG